MVAYSIMVYYESYLTYVLYKIELINLLLKNKSDNIPPKTAPPAENEQNKSNSEHTNQ